MSTPLSLIASGSFTSDGAARSIVLPNAVDCFRINNRSTWGTNPAAVVESFWYRGYGAGQAKTITESGAGALSGTLIAAGGAGFTEITGAFATSAATAVTAITNANPAVASSGTTPLVGEIVRLTGTTGQLQIAGMEFEVTAVTPGVTFTLGYLDASAFVAAATAGAWRRITDLRYLPRRRWITGITAANPCVVTTSIAHGYAVGQRVTVHTTARNNMTQINGRTARITAVTASTFTLDLDASAFTAFVFPTSAVGATGYTPAHVVPAGELGSIVAGAQNNDSTFALNLGTGVVGANTNVMDWVAFAREYTV